MSFHGALFLNSGDRFIAQVRPSPE